MNGYLAARNGVFAAFLAIFASAMTAAGADGAPLADTDGSTLPTVVDARIVGDGSRARFVADLTDRIDVGVFTLADPYRIVIDLPEVRFDLTDSAVEKGRGLVSAFRYGLISPGKSRIVLDIDKPVRIDKSFVLPPSNDQPARLVVDVVPTTRAAFLEAGRAYRESQSLIRAAIRDRNLVKRQKPGSGKPVVVIDPGHGGIDTGAKGRNGTVEKDVTLAFATVLAEKLEETDNYDVYLTRDDDEFVALSERVAFARSHNADLFMSVHANSFRGRSVRGAIVYTISETASDAMAEETAAAENRADVLAGLDIADEDSDEVEDILLDLTRRETHNFGIVFARNLVKELKDSTRMFKVPHKRAGFRVLEAPDVPSAMIELGFMSNAEDEKLLVSEEWRAKTADSVVRAVGIYFRPRLAQQGNQ